MLFLGSGRPATGSAQPIAAALFGNPQMYQYGLENNPSPSGGAAAVTAAVGAVKMSNIPMPAKCVVNGDSVNG